MPLLSRPTSANDKSIDLLRHYDAMSVEWNTQDGDAHPILFRDTFPHARCMRDSV